MSHAFDIAQVRWPAGRAFVADERLASDEIDLTLGALSAHGSIHTSRSPVAGTSMQREGVSTDNKNRTSAATNARHRSTKSGFIAQLASQAPEFLTQPPDLDDAFSLWNLQAESPGPDGRPRQTKRSGA
jgi:hypothetical protein